MNQIPKTKLMEIMHGLFFFKIRYGLLLCSKVRTTEEYQRNKLMKSVQTTQNRLLRMLNNSKINDRISTETMLIKFNLMSVHQLAGQIKLNETWKTIETDDYANQMQRNVEVNETTGINLRPGSRRELNKWHKLKVAKSSFRVDAAKL